MCIVLIDYRFVTNYLPVTPAAPAPGGVDDVLWLSAKIVPNATPAAAIAPILSSSERVWCCLAGAMATPAGFEAAPPAVGTFSALAAPAGSCGFLGCGASGACSVVVVVVVFACGVGEAFCGSLCCCCEASG